MELTEGMPTVEDETSRDATVTVTKGLFVRIEAKPGRGDEVAAHIKAGLPTILDEPDTTAWLAIRLGPTSFAVVDAFPHEEGRQSHLEAGKARLSKDTAMDLFAEPPSMTYTDIVAAKLPG